MSKRVFGILITVGIIVGIVIMAISMGVSAQNKAINLEEQIHESSSAIEIQEKRRLDLIYNLVDTVKNYDKHEGETLTGLAEARTQAQQGNVEEARMAIQAVAEAYPDLNSVENYKTLMNELSTTENLIAEHRNNYNIQVKQYNKHIRVFPNSFFLNVMGYEKVNVDYLEYDAPADAPTNLFGEE